MAGQTPFCNVHTEYIDSIENLNRTVNTLNNNVLWLTRLGKWLVTTLVIVGLSVGGAFVTFVYKASDVAATVNLNKQRIERLEEGDDGFSQHGS